MEGLCMGTPKTSRTAKGDLGLRVQTEKDMGYASTSPRKVNEDRVGCRKASAFVTCAKYAVIVNESEGNWFITLTKIKKTPVRKKKGSGRGIGEGTRD